MWYAAHFLTAHIGEGDSASGVIVEETISLVESSDEEEAYSKADILAKSYASSGISYLDPLPSKIKSYGILKIVDISNLDLGNDDRPHDKTEISYNLYKFESEDDIVNFVEGREFSAIVYSSSGE
jgi:hypothetical protein